MLFLTIGQTYTQYIQYIQSGIFEESVNQQGYFSLRYNDADVDFYPKSSDVWSILKLATHDNWRGSSNVSYSLKAENENFNNFFF